MVSRGARGVAKAELSCEADSENNLGGSSETMYYIGLDVHKRTISYCVKDAAGCVHMEGKIGSTRRELDAALEEGESKSSDSKSAILCSTISRSATRSGLSGGT